MKHLRDNKKGFTLVELIVVLAISAILATLVGGGLIAYVRMARFEHNESNARTLFQTAQIALTHRDTAGTLDAFLQEVQSSGCGENGTTSRHFDASEEYGASNAEDAEERNKNIYALYYDKNDTSSTASQAVRELLDPYIYDDTLLNASICIEIDIETGQVYSVFYDTASDKLRFTDSDGATCIYNRSYDYRRNNTLVGYYSAEDSVNVVELTSVNLHVKNARLTNAETLYLSWTGNAKYEAMAEYEITVYEKASDGGLGAKRFSMVVNAYGAGGASTGSGSSSNNIASIDDFDVTVYDETTGQATVAGTYYFPISYSGGTFILTLDAMADANTLRSAENNSGAEKSCLYSITRFIEEPQDIIVTVRAKAADGYEDSYVSMTEEQAEQEGGGARTNAENTLFASGSTGDAGTSSGTLTYFRHIYNLRWAQNWQTDSEDYTYTIAATNTLNWTSGDVVVYCAETENAAGAINKANPKVPSTTNVVAWPTISTLPQNTTLTGSVTTILQNLQLTGSSVAVKGHEENENLRDLYIGLIGENNGTIENLTLRDFDVLVNAAVKSKKPDSGNCLYMEDGTYLVELDTSETDYRADIRAVGALCGVSTGSIKNCTLAATGSKNTKSRVLAALRFDDTVTEKDRGTAKTETVSGTTYTYYENEPRGVGGLVGVAMPTSTAELNLTVGSTTAAPTVAGLLVDEGGVSANAEDETANTTEQQEKARFNAATASTGTADWRAIGVGGVIGTLNASSAVGSNITLTNAASVTGSAFTGGIAGNLYGSGSTSTKLTGLSNTGTVSAGTNYDASTSSVLGQFFGGIAGYTTDITLQNAQSNAHTWSAMSAAVAAIKNGYTSDGSLTDTSPLRGDFVGGLVGFGRNTKLDECTVGSGGYVLGRTFVGGFAGGLAGSEINATSGTNESTVLGNRYVGGIVSVNGANSKIHNMTNKGLVSAIGLNSAYAGGIAGVNDASWGNTASTSANTALLDNCTSDTASDTNQNANNITFLQNLATATSDDLTYGADFVGGITGYNGKNGTITVAGGKVGAILYGDSFVGGLAGYIAPDSGSIYAVAANGEVDNAAAITISGRVTASGSCVGGYAGMNRAVTLPALTIQTEQIEGRFFVGGVMGADLPNGAQTIQNVTTANAEGINKLYADGIAGGIYGYAAMLAYDETDNPYGDTSTFAENKITVNSSEKTTTTEYERLTALLPELDSDNVLENGENSGTALITVSKVTNALHIYANAYAGGIGGYINANTYAVIKDCVNNGNLYKSDKTYTSRETKSKDIASGQETTTRSASLSGGINVSAYLDAYGYTGDYRLYTENNNTYTEDSTTKASFLGGIAGINTPNTLIESCTNSGTIAAGGAVMGGIVGLNEGAVNSCTLTLDIGAQQSGYDYIGGIAGVNVSKDGKAAVGNTSYTCGTVQDSAIVSGKTVRGGIAVGGVVGANMYGATVKFENTSPTGYSVAGVRDVGGLVGIDNGTITVNGNVINGLTVNISTANGGGVSGYRAKNASAVLTFTVGNVVVTGGQAVGGAYGVNASNNDACGITVKGAAVSGSSAVGGVAGINKATLGNGNAAGYAVTVTDTTVTASGQYAGGVAGQNEGSVVSASVTAGAKVTATTGDAGGVAGYNSGTVSASKVTEDAAVTANSGDAGGIAGYNKNIVTSCSVTGSATVTSSASGRAAGIAAQNASGAAVTGCYVGSDESTGTTVAITANGGMAAGLVALNSGTVNGTPADGSTITSSVYNCTITGAGDAIGAATAYNDDAGTVTSVNIAYQYGSVKLAGSAKYVGALAGENSGSITTCTVADDSGRDNSDFDTKFVLDLTSLTSQNLIVGGAVGYNSSGTAALTNVTVSPFTVTDRGGKDEGTGTANADLSRITHLGGVAGYNCGTLTNCTFAGTLGKVDLDWADDNGKNDNSTGEAATTGATNPGDTIGGIVGYNASGTISDCNVASIKLHVKGAYNSVNETDTAAQKITKSSMVGGVAGYNGGTISSSYIAAEDYDGTTNTGSLISARYGLVGGIAGANAGIIQESGSKAAVVDKEDGTQSIVNYVRTMLTEDDNVDKDVDRDVNKMVDVLSGEDTTSVDYSVLQGTDTVSENEKGELEKILANSGSNTNYGERYSNSSLQQNNLTVVLRGLFKKDGKGTVTNSAKASGALGGIVGLNMESGQVTNSATGHWFVYGDNVDEDSNVGGIIGQNESGKDQTNLVNCAAVRSFIRNSFSNASFDNDWNYWNRSRGEIYVGGVVGTQYNHESEDWSLTNCVNYGTVFSSFSNNVGGVVALWKGYGGTVKRCFNFGTLTTNANNTATGADGGAVGGIVSCYKNSISGSTVTVLSCQNYGSILLPSQENTENHTTTPSDDTTKQYSDGIAGADFGAGIFGRILQETDSASATVNISDCVNSAQKIMAHTGAAGILGSIGTDDDAYKEYKITVNINRCRNYTTEMTAGKGNPGCDQYVNKNEQNGPAAPSGWIAGIVGESRINKKTNIINCFSLVGADSSYNAWRPIAYVNDSYKEDETNKLYGAYNYYMDSFSFSKTDTASTKYLGTDKTTGAAPDGNGVQEKYKNTYEEYSNKNYYIYPKQEKINAHRLFVMQAASDSAYAKSSAYGSNTYFAALLNLTENGNATAYDPGKLTDQNAYLVSDGGDTGWETLTESKRIKNTYNGETTTLGQLLLFFTEEDGLDYTGASNDAPSLHDVTDEVLQAYYKNVLESTQPEVDEKTDKLYVYRSGETDTAGENVYGGYVAEWSIADARATSYRVDIYWVDDTIAEDTQADADTKLAKDDPVYSGTAYASSYQFDLSSITLDTNDDGTPDSTMLGKKFYVTVTPQNAAGGESKLYSKVMTAALTLPTPDLEVRLVKGCDLKGSTDNTSAYNTSAYYNMLVLNNAQAYTTAAKSLTADGNSVKITADFESDSKTEFVFTVTADSNGEISVGTTDGSTVYQDAVTGDYMIAIPDGTAWDARMDTTLVGKANVVDSSDTVVYTGNWLRSAQYRESIGVPSVNTPQANTTYAGLSKGTLSIGTPTLTVGTDGSLQKVTTTITFTPTTMGKISYPTYRVMLIAQYSGDDTISDGVSLQGQYVTLAAAEATPVDTLGVVDNEKFHPGAVEVTLDSLPDDLTGYSNFKLVAVPVDSGYSAFTTRRDATESEVTAAIGSDSSGVGVYYNNALEIIWSSDGIYTYSKLTPLYYFNDSIYDNGSKVPEIQQTELDVTLLTAPTLGEEAVGTLSNTNELTYRFTWTQEDETDKGSTEYVCELYGVTTETDESGNTQTAETLLKTATVSTTDADSNLAYNNETYSWTVDADNLDGGAAWSYNTVRLEVRRKVADDENTATSATIGLSAEKEYPVKQRMPIVSTATVSPVDNGNNAERLDYTVAWTAIGDKTDALDHYVIIAEKLGTDDDGNETWQKLGSTDETTGLTVFGQTTDTETSLTVDLQKYQGETLRFYVLAVSDDTYWVSPDNEASDNVTVVTRQAAPTISGAKLIWTHTDENGTTTTESTEGTTNPSQDEFTGSLQVQMTVTDNTDGAFGSFYFTGYLFKDEGVYNEVRDDVSAGTTLSQAVAKLKSTDGVVLVTANATTGTAATYTKETDAYTVTYNLTSADAALTLTPDYAGYYLLPAVRTMPTTGSGCTPSAWSCYTGSTRLPNIQLDTPETNVTSYQRELTARLYYAKTSADNGEDPIKDNAELSVNAVSVVWSSLNSYTYTDKQDAAGNNLTVDLVSGYSFTMEMADGTAYEVEFTVAPQDEYETTTTTNEDGTTTKTVVTDENGEPVLKTRRGEITGITRTKLDADNNETTTTSLVKSEAADGTVTYDLNRWTEKVEKKDENGDTVKDENGNTVYELVTVDDYQTLEGNCQIEDTDGATSHAYYKTTAGAQLIVTYNTNDGTPTYRVVLPDLAGDSSSTSLTEGIYDLIAIGHEGLNDGYTSWVSSEPLQQAYTDGSTSSGASGVSLAAYMDEFDAPENVATPETAASGDAKAEEETDEEAAGETESTTAEGEQTAGETAQTGGETAAGSETAQTGDTTNTDTTAQTGDTETGTTETTGTDPGGGADTGGTGGETPAADTGDTTDTGGEAEAYADETNDTAEANAETE